MKLLKSKSLNILVVLCTVLFIGCFTIYYYDTVSKKEITPIEFNQRVNDVRTKLIVKRYLNDDIAFSIYDNYIIAGDYINNYDYLLTFGKLSDLPQEVSEYYLKCPNVLLQYNDIDLLLAYHASDKCKDNFTQRITCVTSDVE